uniref:Uncharacterized protein n=1 Tax=Moniliophthora roreri TaxID=221103 RepID=A0A0W0G535_MONRR
MSRVSGSHVQTVFLYPQQARRRRLKDQRSSCTFWALSTKTRSNVDADLTASPSVTTSAVENERFAPVCYYYYQRQLPLTAVLSSIKCSLDSTCNVTTRTTVFVCWRWLQALSKERLGASFM